VTDSTPSLDEMFGPPPDRVVTRINELLTSVLDVSGSLGLVFSVGWIIWGAPWRQALAVAIAGILVIAFSNVAQRRTTSKPPPVVEPDEVIPLPGPSDPGHIHFAGR
jgi:hypothetical protein